MVRDRGLDLKWIQMGRVGVVGVLNLKGLCARMREQLAPLP